jgi:hypothetical protein
VSIDVISRPLTVYLSLAFLPSFERLLDDVEVVANVSVDPNSLDLPIGHQHPAQGHEEL